MKSYYKTHNFGVGFSKFRFLLRKCKKNDNTYMDSEKIINSFLTKKIGWLFIDNYFVDQFVENFSILLLYKINVRNIFNIVF